MENRKIDVTALGEVLIDFVAVDSDDEGYPTLKANPGGAPCNFLAALSAYGHKTAIIAKVGDDAFGRMLLDTMRSRGISTKAVISDPEVFTTLAFVTLDKDGDRSFSFARKPGADTCLSESDISEELIADSKVFHFGSLSLTDEPSRSATYKAVAVAREKGCLISFDPNLRVPLWRDLSFAKEQMLWGLSKADIVKISDEEAQFLFGCGPEEAAETIFERYGCRLVFVTLGADGCCFATRRVKGQIPGIRVNCIDTTGAGDIFGGTALSQILKSGKDIEELDEQELREITEFAVTAASLSTEKLGGITSVPDEKAVLEYRQANGLKECLIYDAKQIQKTNPMIRKAVVEDSSRIAEILIFTKRVNYRSIFNDDRVSFDEMQVYPLAKEYMDDAEKLKNIWVYDDGFVKGMIHIEGQRIEELYVDTFFENCGIGKQLLEFAVADNGCNSVWVLEKNSSAIRFYERHGFSMTGKRDCVPGTGEYIAEMVLN